MGTGSHSPRRAVSRFAILLGIAAAANACAVATATAADEAPAPVQRVVGKGTEVTGDGLYRVDPAVGEPVLTHGPDERASIVRPAEMNLAADGTGFAPGAVERQPVCASDYYEHVVYAYVSGTPNRVGEVTGELRSVVGRMDAVLNAASVASGGLSADYKVLCDDAGQVRVDALEIPGPSFSEIVAAARAAGLNSDRADYLVFVDGRWGGSCGIASYRRDEELDADNVSNSGQDYAAVWAPCWGNETPMHESAHMMGAVQYGAPHSTGTGGHCNEDLDVLCYSPDGGSLNQGGMIMDCPDSVQFDCDYDDYFDSAPEPGEYLDSHWNLGSPLNRFIAFGGAAAPPDSSPPPVEPGKQQVQKLGKRRGAAGERGDWRRYKVRVRGHTRWLKVRMFAAPGADLGLFVRRGKEPTRDVYTCRAAGNGRHATCRIEDPAPGIWHAGVLTRGGQIGAGYRISARLRR